MAGKLASPPNSAVITQLTLNSVKLCYSFSEVHCLHALYNQTVIDHLFYDYKKALHFNKEKLSCFLRVFQIFITGISYTLHTNKHFILKMGSNVHEIFICPN